MDEKDSSDEENNNNNSPKIDVLSQVKNIEDEEEEKSEEESSEDAKHKKKKKVNPMPSFMNVVNQAKKNAKNGNIIDTNTEIKNDDIEDEKDIGDNSFEETLLLECQKEDEENEKKIKEKEF